MFRIFPVFITISVFSLLSLSVFAENPPVKKKVIVIDAGHGGSDSGAIGKRAKEKDIVLAIALKLGKYIDENLPNVKVEYTRSTDVFLELYERAEIANKHKADLFISIHANAVKNNPRPSGTETWVMGLHKSEANLEVAKLENSAIMYEDNYEIKYEGFDPKSPESYIIFSLITNTNLDQSLKAAALVQDEFRERVKRKDRGVKQAGFLVLWKATMPSILIETGFISNPAEEKFLASEQGQDYLASAIYRAVRSYIEDIEKSEEALHIVENKANQEEVSEINVESEGVGSKVEPLFFSVQVATTSTKLANNHPLRTLYKSVNETETKAGYKYSIGQFSTIEDAKSKKIELSKEFPDSFIVAFNNGELISVRKAMQILNGKN